MSRLSRPRPKKPAHDFLRRIEPLLGSAQVLGDFMQSLDRLKTQPARVIRLNTQKMPLAELKELIASERLQLGTVSPYESSAFELIDFQGKAFRDSPLQGAGLVYVQDPGTLEAVDLLDPQSGDVVCDFCAAPGGKSTQIASRMELLKNPKSKLILNEVSSQRLRLLKFLTARWGLGQSVQVHSLSSDKFVDVVAESFDKILLDVPCSGESFFAKRKETRSDVKTFEVQALAKIQFSILQNLSAKLKNGGRLVYSTCTYSKEENEEVVHRFIEHHHTHFVLKKELRRWPHVDGFAGGYMAVIERIDGFDESSLVRSKSKVDYKIEQVDQEYQMYLDSIHGNHFKIELSDLQARAYLRGEAIIGDYEVKGLVCVSWKGFVLGPAKAVDGRLNNLLPKILRES